jgi:hypothetical protein
MADGTKRNLHKQALLITPYLLVGSPYTCLFMVYHTKSQKFLLLSSHFSADLLSFVRMV